MSRLHPRLVPRPIRDRHQSQTDLAKEPQRRPAATALLVCVRSRRPSCGSPRRRECSTTAATRNASDCSPRHTRHRRRRRTGSVALVRGRQNLMAHALGSGTTIAPDPHRILAVARRPTSLFRMPSAAEGRSAHALAFDRRLGSADRPRTELRPGRRVAQLARVVRETANQRHPSSRGADPAPRAIHPRQRLASSPPPLHGRRSHRGLRAGPPSSPYPLKSSVT